MYCMPEKVFIECVRFLLSDDLSRWGDAGRVHEIVAPSTASLSPILE